MTHCFYNGVYIQLDKKNYSESPNIICLNYVYIDPKLNRVEKHEIML